MSKAVVGVGIVCVAIGGAIGWTVAGKMAGSHAGGPPGGFHAGPPASVVAIQVKESVLAPVDQYIARVEPLQEVGVRPEVAGKIESVHFIEGTQVQEGDLLFTIDPAAYQATVDAAKARMISAQKRYDRLKNADARSVSASDLETGESDYLQSKADYELALVNLEYTKIVAPVTGRIGSAIIKKGNYVSPGSDELARIVQLNPIRVVFSQTDREFLAHRRREVAGETDAYNVRLKLADGLYYSKSGEKDFDDNAMDPMTGTIAVRYLFDNTDGLLVPGAFVTAELKDANGLKGIKIPQAAVLLDQQGSYVLTVDEAGVVSAARIETAEQAGENIVVSSGLTVGDRVVVDGLQKANPGATVIVSLLEK